MENTNNTEEIFINVINRMFKRKEAFGKHHINLECKIGFKEFERLFKKYKVYSKLQIHNKKYGKDNNLKAKDESKMFYHNMIKEYLINYNSSKKIRIKDIANKFNISSAYVNNFIKKDILLKDIIEKNNGVKEIQILSNKVKIKYTKLIKEYIINHTQKYKINKKHISKEFNLSKNNVKSIINNNEELKYLFDLHNSDDNKLSYRLKKSMSDIEREFFDLLPLEVHNGFFSYKINNIEDLKYFFKRGWIVGKLDEEHSYYIEKNKHLYEQYINKILVVNKHQKKIYDKFLNEK